MTAATTIALYAIPVSMVGLVFLCKAITNRNHVWLDILIFVIVIVIAQAIFVLLLAELAAGIATNVIAGLFLAGLLGAFLRFTLRPPREPDVFIDPLTGRYGLSAHPDLDGTPTQSGQDSRADAAKASEKD